MTTKQRSFQISLLRALHLSPRYVNAYKEDPIAYRAFLKKHLGVDSSKELKLEVLIELVKYFDFKRDDVPSNGATSQQVAFIRHLWNEHATHKDEESLLSFVERTLNKRLSTLEKLTPKEASQMIAGIKKLKPQTVAFANNPNFKGE